jgi:hypothetical protein
MTAADTPIPITAFVPELSEPSTAFEVAAAEVDIAATLGDVVLVAELVVEAKPLVKAELVVEEEPLLVLLGLNGAVVLLMIKTSLCARIAISVSKYRAKMYVFERVEFMPLDASRSTDQPAGLTFTVSGTACSANNLSFYGIDEIKYKKKLTYKVLEVCAAGGVIREPLIQPHREVVTIGIVRIAYFRPRDSLCLADSPNIPVHRRSKRDSAIQACNEDNKQQKDVKSAHCE